MTGVSEMVVVRTIPASPDLVRLSVVGGATQLDVSLPMDTPVASLLPELVRLVRSRDTAQGEPPSDAKESRHDVWTLRRTDGSTPLPAGSTLRDAGVVNGELLALTAERALSAPVLYDDVVDAAARLNRASYAGWGAPAAQWMTFAGLHLAAFAWVYFLVADAFARHRGVMIGVSALVAAALVGGAALANRSHGRADIGAALGWAAIPIGGAIAWTSWSGVGEAGAAAACATMLVLVVLIQRAVGTGHFGCLASGVTFGLVGLATTVHALGIGTEVAAAGLAAIATLGCLAVAPMTSRLARFETPTVAAATQRSNAIFENPFTAAEPTGAKAERAESPTAETVWARARSATSTRSALYAGCAVAATAGCAAAVRARTETPWSAVALALVCAAALALYGRRSRSGFERASLAVPAVVLLFVGCLSTQAGAPPMPLIGFGIALVAVIAFTATGMVLRDGRSGRRWSTPLDFLDYAVSAAVIPTALWVTGLYDNLGF